MRGNPYGVCGKISIIITIIIIIILLLIIIIIMLIHIISIAINDLIIMIISVIIITWYLRQNVHVEQTYGYMYVMCGTFLLRRKRQTNSLNVNDDSLVLTTSASR